MNDLVRDLQMPKSVLVASDSLYSELAGGANSVHLLQKLDAMVVPYSTTPYFNELRVIQVRDHLDQCGQLIEGSLLIKNPYDPDTFELAENAIAAFAADKYLAMAKVAGLLGAVEVTFGEARIESEQTEWAAGLKARFKIGNGEASVKREVQRQVTSRIDAHLTYPGGRPSPEQARGYLARRNLSRDTQLEALVELRSGPNAVISFDMKMNGTRESESNLRCALDLANAGPVKLLQIGATFTKTAKLVKDVEITTQIRFPTSD